MERTPSARANDGLLDRLDVTFTHPILGLVVFLGVMAGLFWAIFALATVPMDLIEATFAHLGGWLEGSLPPGAVRDLLVGGLLGGVSGTVVFLPQICLLFFLITLLEDTGYLARAAFVMDRLLCRFGLPGHAFVPLLSSHACAIPGILSARLIPDRWDRFTTILVAPFMSCSARLPVYVLLTTFLFRGSAVSRRPCLRRVLPPRRARGVAQRLARAPHGAARRVTADDPRAAHLQAAVAASRIGHRVRPGLVISAHRGHGHPGDLPRHVVAVGVPEGGAVCGRG